ncbi:hypothetical protein EUTSA_v10022389mg [Eutrema salsugineum]|uniref:S-protein homolog n=1 Tax=Eutrema salsugineum TaxID=72664 RepID=V4LWM8_EUTSA|nr:hypothetical protein EUTSA_v10022389mg [Eutrema salsugineum]
MFINAAMSRNQNDVTPSGFDNPKTTVTIYNDLGSDLPLQYHCKSNDDDLGDRVLASGGSWSFQFKPSVFGNTFFSCSFSWENQLHYFDIYKYKRDRIFAKFGCRKCGWKIRKNGPCKLNKNTKMFDVCHSWKS